MKFILLITLILAIISCAFAININHKEVPCLDGCPEQFEVPCLDGCPELGNNKKVDIGGHELPCLDGCPEQFEEPCLDGCPQF
ncbi:hypothetical protein CYY_004941 [Polysphondylium violaceum]|uniref:Uncharacterized protein n=1 Tax=Polysphondylium violaceum TaxID=133409 RepID=A0A8J4V7A2_9MYCE|nr:hypothetical protein CYY_004941 [Polysphondylium violaceum]